MKNIVHTPQRIRQGQSIGHGPLSFHNLEGSHELGREFSSLSKLDRILMRLNPQEDSIVDLVTTVDSMRIGITLLSILRFFNLVLLFAFALPFLGSLQVPPGPYPQDDPNSKASNTVTRKETRKAPS